MANVNEFVQFEIKDRVAFVTLNRPEKRNAFSKVVFEGLDRAFASLTTAVRAVSPKPFFGMAARHRRRARRFRPSPLPSVKPSSNS